MGAEVHTDSGVFRLLFDYVGKDRRRLRRGTRAFSREVDVGHARIFVDHGFQWDGAKNVWLTRARASFVLGTGPIFDIKPRAFLARVTGFFGGTSSGDPCFDDFFRVRTTAAEETWSALTTRARSLLAGSFEDACLVSDGHMVTLWREAEFGLEADANTAIELVAEIVCDRRKVLRNLERLPGGIPYRACGAWDERTRPGIIVHAPAPVHIGPVEGEEGPVLAAWAGCGKALPRFTIHIDKEGLLSEDAKHLPDPLHRALGSEFSGCTLRCDGRQLALQWPRLTVQSKQLLGGARLVASLSRGARSLYR